MSVGLAILFVLFVVLLLLGLPIAFVLGTATALALLAMGYSDVPLILASDLANGIDSFALLAIPFFILAGEIMGAGGLARRLIDLAAALVGRYQGGLPVVNTLTCMLFGSISGSATAAVSAIGGTLIPEMNRQGYPKDYNIALTACAATTGLLIPPSNVMIVFALIASNVSVAALFVAGILPGILMGLGIMAAGVGVAKLRGYGPSGGTATRTLPPLGLSIWRAFPSLLLILIVLGGILGGVFTPTEASAIAVFWALLLAAVFYREIKLSQLPEIALRAAKTTAVVLFLVATSYAMSRFLTQEQVPQKLSAAVLNLSENPILILLLINVMLLLVGVVMDMTPAIVIFTPLFLPPAMAIGVEPIHFGIIMIANLCIGLLTPPVGTCLFVGAGVGQSEVSRVSRQMIPFYVVMIGVLLIITFVPALSTALPKFLNQ